MPLREIQKLLLEALVVAAVGAALAFGANALSPRGLALGRDYFPARVKTTNTVAATNVAAPVAPADLSSDAAVDARLKGKGLVRIDRETTLRLLGNAQVVFVDARDEEKFEAGHVPGAYELDPYHPERTFGTILPLCLAANKVVVYCEGGECEDADSMAIMLRDGGVSADKLVVYGGGMKEWSAHHDKVETGAHS